MKSNEHFEGYAFALLELSIENKAIQKYRKQAILLMNEFEQFPKYIKILESNLLDIKLKKELLVKSFGTKIDKIIYNFLFLLMDKNKIRYVTKIFSLYVNHINKMSNIHEGIIYSRIELSSSNIKKIVTKISKQLGWQITLTNIIDEAIIAGFKIKISDIIIDWTLNNQLKQMKQTIIEGNN